MLYPLSCEEFDRMYATIQTSCLSTDITYYGSINMLSHKTSGRYSPEHFNHEEVYQTFSLFRGAENIHVIYKKAWHNYCLKYSFQGRVQKFLPMFCNRCKRNQAFSVFNFQYPSNVTFFGAKADVCLVLMCAWCCWGLELTGNVILKD